MTCMQAALIAWITIRLWTHFLAYNPALAFAEQHPALEAVLVTTEGDVLATSGIGDRVLFELLG